MYKENFPIRIKKARQMTGFTQIEVAKETNISQSTLTKYETGRIEPSLENLGILAEFYGVSIDWLLGIGTQGVKPNYVTRDVSFKQEISYNASI